MSGHSSFAVVSQRRFRCIPGQWSTCCGHATLVELCFNRRRRPTWAMNGSTFCLGSATGDAVLALDFSRGTSSPCAIDSEPAPTPLHHTNSIETNKSLQPDADCHKGIRSDTVGDTGTAPRGMASAVRIPVSQPVVSLTTHPVTDELIAGTQNGYLLLLSPSSRSKASVGSGEEDDEHGGGN